MKRVTIDLIGERAGFLGGRQHTDTVVFVHGFCGHFRETWGFFPELLLSDADMPEVDVLLWGYPTG